MDWDASRIKTYCLVAHTKHPSSLRTVPADLRTLANTSRSTLSPLAFSDKLILLNLKQQIFDLHASASLDIGGRLKTGLCIPVELTVGLSTAAHLFAFSSQHTVHLVTIQSFTFSKEPILLGVSDYAGTCLNLSCSTTSSYTTSIHTIRSQTVTSPALLESLLAGCSSERLLCTRCAEHHAEYIRHFTLLACKSDTSTGERP